MINERAEVHLTEKLWGKDPEEIREFLGRYWKIEERRADNVLLQEDQREILQIYIL